MDFFEMQMYKEKNVAETLQLLNLFLTLMEWEYHSHFSW